MNQLHLFDSNTVPPPPPSPYAPSSGGSVSGNRWHDVCESRLQQYGFRKIDSRYMLGGVIEFDGFFKTQPGLYVLAEYKERIDLRIYKELIGQARIGHMLNRYNYVAIIILTGFLEPGLLSKESLVNAGSDDIYLIGNPQHTKTEAFLRQLAAVRPDLLYGITYANLSQRIAKHGGFAATFTPKIFQ
jgi:hypothetical protein